MSYCWGDAGGIRNNRFFDIVWREHRGTSHCLVCTSCWHTHLFNFARYTSPLYTCERCQLKPSLPVVTGRFVGLGAGTGSILDWSDVRKLLICPTQPSVQNMDWTCSFHFLAHVRRLLVQWWDLYVVSWSKQSRGHVELHHKVSPDFRNVSTFPIAFVVRVVFFVSRVSHTTYVLMVHAIIYNSSSCLQHVQCQTISMISSAVCRPVCLHYLFCPKSSTLLFKCIELQSSWWPRHLQYKQGSSIYTSMPVPIFHHSLRGPYVCSLYYTSSLSQ